jgi:hypothetical protein
MPVRGVYKSKSNPRYEKGLGSTSREETISPYEALINLHYGNILAELTASGHAVDKQYVDLEREEIKKLETLIRRCAD